MTGRQRRDILSGMSLNDHKLTFGFAVLTILCGAILPYVPQVSAGLATSIMGALGTIGMLIKTYSAPPPGRATP